MSRDFAREVIVGAVIAEVLLKNGADPNLRQEAGYVALHSAAMRRWSGRLSVGRPEPAPWRSRL